jgi:hypothetical protein
MGGSRIGAALEGREAVGDFDGDQNKRAIGTTPFSIKRFKPAIALSITWPPNLKLQSKGLEQPLPLPRGLIFARGLPWR